MKNINNRKSWKNTPKDDRGAGSLEMLVFTNRDVASACLMPTPEPPGPDSHEASAMAASSEGVVQVELFDDFRFIADIRRAPDGFDGVSVHKVRVARLDALLESSSFKRVDPARWPDIGPYEGKVYRKVIPYEIQRAG